jgi:hypothetical protein
VAAGDVLVAFVTWEYSSLIDTATVAEVGGGNSFTMLTVTYNGGGLMRTGYVLNATANSSSTFRFTLSTARGYRSIIVLQFRPDVGDTVSLDAGPAAGTGTGTTLQSATFSTTGTDEIIAGGIKQYVATATYSNHQIADTAADNHFEEWGSTIEASAWYKIFTSEQTNIHTQCTSSSNAAWINQAIAIKAVASVIHNCGVSYCTICPSGQGCNYETLSAWESNQQADLTGLGPEIAVIQGDWTGVTDSTPVIISGWTTTASDYIYIYTAPSARHSGVWDDTKYHLVVSDATGIFVNDPKHIRLDGLQVYVSSVSASWRIGIDFYMNSDADVRISNCIIRGAGIVSSYDSHSGIHSKTAGTATGTSYMWNNIIYDFDASGGYSAYGIYLDDTAGSTHYVYNNTLVNNYYGLMNFKGNCIAKNNLSYSNEMNYYAVSGTWDAASTNNLSGPTASDAPGDNPQNAKTVSFVSGNYKLSTTDTNAKDHAVSNPGSGLFSDDIGGQLRISIWDIGADEIDSVINTRDKRASVINMLMPFGRVLPTPGQ